MHERRGWLGWLVMATIALGGRAAAQQGERLPPAPPPVAAPAQSAPAPAAAAQPQPATAPAATTAPTSPPAGAAPAAAGSAAMPTFDLCTPACRAGFVCAQGQCVSACNPPCAVGEQCTAEAQCKPEAAQAPQPPSFYTPGGAIEPPPDLTAERHDGFMLRLALGFGYGGATRQIDNDRFGLLGGDGKTTLSGVGMSFSLDLGAAVADNVVIHGRFADYVIALPDVHRRGEEISDDNDENAVSAALLAIAVTYYFMPVNVYLTGAIGVAGTAIGIRQEDDDAHGGGGLGLNFDVGKEWWVGKQWGLGAAARFWYSHGTNDEGGIDADYSLVAFALMFSATYQ